MKRLFLAGLLLFSIQSNLHSQEIARDEIDKYLKVHIRETTWHEFVFPWKINLKFRMRLVERDFFLELYITQSGAFRIDESDDLYFLLDNEESIRVECVRGGIANWLGGSNWRGNGLYKIPDDVRDKLLKHSVKGLRIDLGGQYTTIDKIGKGSAEDFKKGIRITNLIPLQTDLVNTEWRQLFSIRQAHSKAWQRFVKSDSSICLEVKISGYEMQKGGRLNIYFPPEMKISLYATEIDKDEHGYYFVKFPISNTDLELIANNTYNKITLQTASDKVKHEGDNTTRAELRDNALFAINAFLK